MQQLPTIANKVIVKAAPYVEMAYLQLLKLIKTQKK
jgi:hypothetical protein